MSYKLKWEPKGAYWRYYGKVSGLEVLEATMLVYGASRFEELKYKLVSFVDIESIDMTEGEVSAIASRHKAAEKYNPYIKTAIVLRSKTNELANKLANKFAALFSDSSWDVQVFDDLDMANDWLDRKLLF